MAAVRYPRSSGHNSHAIGGLGTTLLWLVLIAGRASAAAYSPANPAPITEAPPSLQILDAQHFKPTPRGGVLFVPPLRRGSSVYPLCQVRHRRRCLMGAKNHAVATRRLLGQAPKRRAGGKRLRCWACTHAGGIGRGCRAVRCAGHRRQQPRHRPRPQPRVFDV